jgi:hypothetical protein
VNPLARQDGLLIRELPDELVVYDRRLHRAHCLNATAALVFRAADGTRTVAELAAVLDPTHGAAERETLVRLALEQLATAGLLDAPGEPGLGSRRAVLRQAAVGVALLLPAVASIIAPTPADAASCPVCTSAREGQACGCPNISVPDCGTCQPDLTCSLPGGGSC